jgi:hypothetical protein
MSKFEAPPIARHRAGTAAPVAARAGGIDFASEIQPLFQRSCLNCHGNEKPRGRFSMTSLEKILQGGHSGVPAIVPGDSAASLLVRHVSDQVEDLEMPPLRRRDKYPPFSPAEVRRIRDWIDAGAVWEKAE